MSDKWFKSRAHLEEGKSIEAGIPPWANGSADPSCSAKSIKQSQDMTKTVKQLINDLCAMGGAIVTTNECSEMEITVAQAEKRFACDDETKAGAIGFIRRPQEWVNKKQNERAN